jgi:adenylate cyclase
MVLTGVLVLLGALAYRFLSAERRGNLFRRAISLFVGTKVASSLEQSNTIALSGTRETLTIMFTDIRGFTAFCDERDAGEVVEVLNEYLAAMVSIIVSHRGQVNKFIGDGILAIFSDEDGTRHGDHATRAVRCAIEMVSRPGRLKTGAGIHTGEAVVGNVGSSDKMEYTVLGDTVNLASRLESLNKEHKTQVLLSEATRRLLNEDLETVHLGTTPVRGKAEPLNLYTPAVLVGAAAGAALSAKES